MGYLINTQNIEKIVVQLSVQQINNTNNPILLYNGSRKFVLLFAILELIDVTGGGVNPIYAGTTNFEIINNNFVSGAPYQSLTGGVTAFWENETTIVFSCPTQLISSNLGQRTYEYYFQTTANPILLDVTRGRFTLLGYYL